MVFSLPVFLHSQFLRKRLPYKIHIYFVSDAEGLSQSYYLLEGYKHSEMQTARSP
jgi:hypothetical protein